jgi:hypothetical protein
MKFCILSLSVYFFIFGSFDVFAQEQIYTGKNGNIIRWENQLPRTFPKINEIKYFGDFMENYLLEDGGIPNCKVTTSFNNNRVIISISTDDQRFNTWHYSRRLNEINPTFSLKVFDHLNSWFFDNIQELNPNNNIIRDLNSLEFIYVFTQYKGDDCFQIQGKIGRARDTWGNYRNGMLPLEPFFIKVGRRSGEVYGLYGMLNAFGLRLANPYNAITNEYNSSYLVYLFFDDQEKIKDIPKLE